MYLKQLIQICIFFSLFSFTQSLSLSRFNLNHLDQIKSYFNKVREFKLYDNLKSRFNAFKRRYVTPVLTTVSENISPVPAKLVGWYQVPKYTKLMTWFILVFLENILTYYWLTVKLEAILINALILFYSKNSSFEETIISKIPKSLLISKIKIINNESYYMTTHKKHLNLFFEIYARVVKKIDWYSFSTAPISNVNVITQNFNFIFGGFIRYTDTRFILFVNLICQILNKFFERTHIISKILDVIFIVLTSLQLISVLFWQIIYARKLSQISISSTCKDVILPVLSELSRTYNQLPPQINPNRPHDCFVM